MVDSRKGIEWTFAGQKTDMSDEVVIQTEKASLKHATDSLRAVNAA